MFTLLQTNLVAGRDVRVSVAELESVVPLMDALRAARPTALPHRHIVDGDDGYPVAWDGDRLVRDATDSGSRLIISETPIGAFAGWAAHMVVVRGDTSLRDDLARAAGDARKVEFGAVRQGPGQVAGQDPGETRAVETPPPPSTSS